jgi:hypothetical protein
VRLAETRAGADAELVTRYEASTRELTVRSAGDGAESGLRLRFAELDPAAQAAVLRLDPIDDRMEYAELLALVETSKQAELGSLFRTGPFARFGRRVSEEGGGDVPADWA